MDSLKGEERRSIGLQSRKCSAARIALVFPEVREAKHVTIAELVQGRSNAEASSSEHLIAGRWEDVREPTEKELKATTVLEFSIKDASFKVRSGPPHQSCR